MFRRICLVLIASVALTGCDMLNNKEDLQYDDARNPFYKQAQQDLDNGNPAAAALDYESAIGSNPKLIEAQYQLGHIYGDKLNDPIGAIFHFQQYLKLSPNSDKADEVKALVDKESQAFAAGLPNSPTESAVDYAKLQADNASLKKQVDDASVTIRQLQDKLTEAEKLRSETPVAAAPVPASAPTDTNAPGATPAAPLLASTDGPSTNAAPAVPPRALPLDATNMFTGATPPGADGGPGKTYKVVSGDSLWKIAHKMYPGDTKDGIDKIKDANKDALPEGKPLKVGQVLIIP